MFGKKLVKWMLLVVNFAAAISLLITLIGTVLSPVKYIIPAYFALLYPVIIITNICFVIFWVFTRKWYFLISYPSMVPLTFTQPKWAFLSFEISGMRANVQPPLPSNFSNQYFLLTRNFISKMITCSTH